METTNVLMLIFSGIVAISTIIYVFLTYKLAEQTRLSREFFLESHIIAYITNSEASSGIVNLVIENIGKGVAKNVKFEIIKDVESTKITNLKDLGIFKNGIKYLPPDRRLKFTLTTLNKDTNDFQNSIIFKVRYSDALQKRDSIFELEYSELEGMGRLVPPDTYLGRISYELSKFNKVYNAENKLKY